MSTAFVAFVLTAGAAFAALQWLAVIAVRRAVGYRGPTSDRIIALGWVLGAVLFFVECSAVAGLWGRVAPGQAVDWTQVFDVLFYALLVVAVARTIIRLIRDRRQLRVA